MRVGYINMVQSGMHAGDERVALIKSVVAGLIEYTFYKNTHKELTFT